MAFPALPAKSIADQIAAIWSVAMMLEHLGLAEETNVVMAAIRATTAEGVLTPDLGGSASTRKVGDAVLAHL